MSIRTTGTNSPLLRLENVSVQYGSSCVLRVPSLRLFPGSALILHGPNGSGKSSLLRGFAGVGPELMGDVVYLDRTLSSIPSYARPRHGLRLLPQGRRVFARLTPAEHLSLASRHFCPRHSGTDGRASLALRTGVMSRPASGTSGGEAKAILLASLLVSGLRVLMLDEPFAGLDEVAIESLLAYLHLAHTMQIAIIIVDHTRLCAAHLQNPCEATIHVGTDTNKLLLDAAR